MNGAEQKGGIGMCEEKCEGQERGKRQRFQERRGRMAVVRITSLPRKKLKGADDKHVVFSLFSPRFLFFVSPV